MIMNQIEINIGEIAGLRISALDEHGVDAFGGWIDIKHHAAVALKADGVHAGLVDQRLKLILGRIRAAIALKHVEHRQSQQSDQNDDAEHDQELDERKSIFELRFEICNLERR